MDVKRFTRFPMKKGEVIQLAQPKGYVIKAESGRLWITQSNNSADFFIEPGDIYIAKENGALVAEALGHSLMSLSFPAANTRQAVADTRALEMAAQGA